MQRDEMTLRTEPPSLPILIFDERKLVPSFGYLFDRKWLDPHESIVSLLWKFARMNRLPGHVIAAQLSRTVIDPYEGIVPSRSAVDMPRLRQTLGIPMKLLRGALLPDSLSRIASPQFRFCRKCLARGYHGVVHQLQTIQHCPIHGGWLDTACPHCELSTPYRLNASLLDTPFRCAHCRQLYGTQYPSFVHRRGFKLAERIALTRSRMYRCLG